MLVTVITLSYKSESTLKAAIDSVLEQTYDEIQYIIVDDGTPEFDRQSVEKYIDCVRRDNIKEFIVLHAENNVGTIRNINRALAYVKGEIIFTLSADDEFFDKTVIVDWVNEFRLSHAEVITAKRAVYDISGNRSVVAVEPSGIQEEAIKNFSSEKLFEYIAPVNIIFGCCTARTIDNIKKYGGYNERYKYIEDYSFNLRYLREGGRFHFFDRVVVKYALTGISAPAHINKSYLKENFSIFKNEALPYIANKKVVKARYRSWKNTLVFDSRRRWLAANTQGAKSFFRRIFAYGVFYIIRYPLLGLKHIFGKLRILACALLKLFKGNKK